MDSIEFWYKKSGPHPVYVVASATVYPPDWVNCFGRLTGLHIDAYSSDAGDASPLPPEILKPLWPQIEEEAEARLLAPWNPASEFHERSHWLDEEAVS